MIAERSFDEKRLMNFLIEMDNAFTQPLSISLGKQGLTIENYAHKLATCATIVYEEDDKGNLKGIVVGYTNNLPEDRSSYITQVVTSEIYRGQGVCTRLLKEYQEFCRHKNIYAIWLTTHMLNMKAQKAYEKAGFIRHNSNNGEQIKYIYFIE